MTVYPRKIKPGFTLVETILATVVLCAAVLTVGTLSTRSLAEIKLNRQYEVAAALADRQLTLIDQIGIIDFLESGQTDGQFEQFQPPYSWKVTAASQGTPEIYLVHIIVTWTESGKKHSVSLETMLSATNAAVEKQ